MTITAPSVLPSSVGVLNKISAILSVLEKGPACLPAVVSETGLKRPTVHRLVLAMQELGLVQADQQGQFMVGPRLTRLAMAAQHAMADRDLRRELSALRATTGASVRLHQRYGDQRICVAEALRLKSTSGEGNSARAIANADPVSCVFLAWRRFSRDHGARDDALACSRIRHRGWVQGADEDGLVLAVAVCGRDGELAAVLSLSSHSQRTRRGGSYDCEVIKGAVEAAARIGARLSAQGATSPVKELEDRVRRVGPGSAG
ncbi:helix-turn-helix domain-containing protein [Streptomyces melanosporofaciens]|uniref:DNA-binding transcriptional regulator, IclR family n=1 Tax=Streptomyces melanosporofaciens TaxID=67327 RepID=A0A1H4IBR0_STRMJ|nr:helix-turn-helix domain-containing protein [Streptomyces melanosporofaciens]SEB31564.1 DNA-binding transcriptional regulator, IclR family [Streptomyces melanosporofaciens]